MVECCLNEPNNIFGGQGLLFTLPWACSSSTVTRATNEFNYRWRQENQETNFYERRVWVLPWQWSLYLVEVFLSHICFSSLSSPITPIWIKGVSDFPHALWTAPYVCTFANNCSQLSFKWPASSYLSLAMNHTNIQTIPGFSALLGKLKQPFSKYKLLSLLSKKSLLCQMLASHEISRMMLVTSLDHSQCTCVSSPFVPCLVVEQCSKQCL